MQNKDIDGFLSDFKFSSSPFFLNSLTCIFITFCITPLKLDRLKDITWHEKQKSFILSCFPLVPDHALGFSEVKKYIFILVINFTFLCC